MFAIVLIAVVTRVSHWPALQEVRDGDELTYTWGSLQLLEGNLPGDHYVPAGLQTWVGWFYEGLISAAHFAHPDNKEREAPIQLRPFLAIDHAVFAAYRDTGQLRQVWIVVSVACSIAAVIAAFRLGFFKAGIPGGILLGGTFAVLPLFVEFSVQARPYIVAWSLGAIALYFALGSTNRRALPLSAVFLGMAIGSRIDMVMLLPVIWSEAWMRDRKQWAQRMLQYHGILLLSFLVTAPWYLMTLVGCLRALGTIRGSSAGQLTAGPVAIVRDLVWDQGMLFQLLLCIVAIIGCFAGRPRRPLLGGYIIILTLSMFKGAVFGLRHQGAPLLILLVVGIYVLPFIRRFSPGLAAGLSIAALLIPAAQTLRLIATTRANKAPDGATEWVESHVPPGSIVYLRPSIHNPLPTASAADESWTEVVDNTAYQRKFRSGLDRFNINASEIPRALSDVNLAVERANRRFMFILGSRPWIDAPRYDARVFESGPVFGVRDLPARFRETGGVVVLRGPASDPLAQALGSPEIAWLNRVGDGTRVYCSPDLVAKLK
jgi:hypothetical protein